MMEWKETRVKYGPVTRRTEGQRFQSLATAEQTNKHTHTQTHTDTHTGSRDRFLTHKDSASTQAHKKSLTKDKTRLFGFSIVQFQIL